MIFSATNKERKTAMKKLIPLLLALVMIATAFAACADKPGPAETTPASGTDPAKPVESTPADGSNTDGEIVDPPTLNYDDLNIDLDAIDYGGADFYIYHWNTNSPEFEADADATDGDPIQNALYLKNLNVEEQLGVTLNFHAEDGGDHYQRNFIEKLELRLSDPETPVDLIAAYSRCAPFVLTSGHAIDLEPYSENLDMSKAWWPSLVREEHEIKGRVFYTSGDASTGLLTQIQAIFMNKTLFKSFGNDYDDFMTDVVNVKKGSGWTLDKFIELTKGVYQDIDEISGESPGDFFGLAGEHFQVVDALWTGCGYRLFELSSDEDKIYTLSTDISGSVASDFVKKMTEWANTNDASITPEDGTWNGNGCRNLIDHFGASKCLFAMCRLGNFDASLVDIEYAVLPAPKANEDQARYYTCVGNPYSLYSICDQSKDKERAAIVLQTYGYYGYELTTPAIYDATYKGKYAKDDYALDCFDAIRGGITFEVGRTFDRITETMLPNLLTNAIVKNAAWTTMLSPAMRKMLDKEVQKNANESILKLLDSLE